MLDTIIFITTTVLSLAITSLVLLRNVNDGKNRALAAFMASVTAWGALNFLADNAPATLLFTRLTYASMSVVGIAIVVLSSYFPTKRWVMQKKTTAVYALIAAIVGIASMTPALVISTEKSGLGLTINTGAFYIPYLLFVVGSVLVAVRNFFKQRKLAKGVEKKQLRLMINGFVLLAVFGILSQLVLPTLINTWSVTRYGPVFITVFIAYISVAIVKYRLFDIRAVVFRGAVYIFSITAVGLIYSALVYGVGGIFIDVTNISYIQRTFFAVLALLIALTYAPILRFFNKYTSKIFYRDAYDTSEVIDQIGKIIVASIDLHKIQKAALAVLVGSLRPTYGGFVLRTEAGVSIQDFIGDSPRLSEKDMELLSHRIGKKEIVYDELAQTTGELAQAMRSSDISLIVPLITKNETIGYFISGPKKSGNIFNQQDKSMMTIAANELAVALQNAQRFEEIQAFNITLQQKVDDATRELKKTNKKLVELDEAKDEFISMASHQLRTPLTSIKGYLSMLMEGDLGKVSKQQEQALKEAFTSSQRMVFLISDFLNVSRIKTGKFVIEPKEVNLSEMVRQELVQLKEMAESKELNMIYEPPVDFPVVKLDENKMHQVMMNMMDNAIYYTPNGGKITVQLYVDGKDVVFKVVDTGIGVPKAEQHKLFGKFFRAGNARKTRPDGTGLGLFMAQKVVVAQGGSIVFESVEGKGSTFGFRFPLSSIKA